MRVEVRKSMEFSLPQAQVFYISSRNKFIVVKTTNPAFAFFFIPRCTPICCATIIPDLLLIRPGNENKYVGAQISTWRLDMSRMAANHVEEQFDDHSDDKIQ